MSKDRVSRSARAKKAADSRVRRAPEKPGVRAAPRGAPPQRAALDAGEPLRLQAAPVRVGPPGDAYEREAEDVARKVVQRTTSDEPVRRTSEPTVQAEPETLRRHSTIHDNTEDKGGTVYRAPTDGPTFVDESGAAAEAVRDPSGGESIEPETRRRLEDHLDVELGHVRVHRDARSEEAAAALRARAFTHRDHIWLGRGQSPTDVGLMAHEATHVRQQGAAGVSRGRGAAPVRRAPDDRVQRDTEGVEPAAKKEEAESAPGVVELRGKEGFEPGPEVAEWLAKQPRKRGHVRVRFGTLAEGPLEVRATKSGYAIKTQSIPLNAHPLFTEVGRLIGAEPRLFLTYKKGKVGGYVGLRKGKGVERAQGVAKRLTENAEALGLPGFTFPSLPKITNALESGALTVELSGIPVRMGKLLSGDLTIKVADDRITAFQGQVAVSVAGLADGTLELMRDDKGEVTGAVDLAVTLAEKNVSGNVHVAWDGHAVTGKGKVGYQGEKLSGSVTLNVMEKEKALQLGKEKKAPAKEGAEGSGKSAKKSKKRRDPSYVLFGEGELDFSFTDWLTGKAQVIVDPKGYTTIIGKITPQKEFELFPQKDFNKHLFKAEARARYGLPVVGNIFIFANVSLDAFAKMGPGKFYNIVVDGTYSNDPEKANDFSIRGSLNVSAAAGVKLRGEAGAGLEILSHDLKAGAGVNAIAAVRAYAEATPVVGYREKVGAPGEDKKGDFFIRGEFEIAGQPFLGLGGDLFVEVDAPWWSPLSDKKWTWPLGNKEYPLGGQLGLGASIDYVFGSGQLPAIEFKPVEFSAEKFFTDLYKDKASPKSGDKPAKKADWKEKNAKSGKPEQGGAAAKGDLKPGPGPKGTPAKPLQTGKVSGKKATPDAKTAEGKSVAELERAAQRDGKKDTRDPKAGGAKKDATKKGADAKKQAELGRALAALDAVTARYAKDGASEEEVKAGVKSVRRKFKKVFSLLRVIDGGKSWDYEYAASPGKKKKGARKAPRGKGQKALEALVKPAAVQYPTDKGGQRAKGPSGFVDGVAQKDRESLPAAKGLPGYMPGDHRGHLIGDRFMGPPSVANLVPMHKDLNLSSFKVFENAAAKRFQALQDKRKPRLLFMKVKPKYPGADPDAPERSFRPESIRPEAYVYALEDDEPGKFVKSKVPGSGKSLSNPEGAGRTRAEPVVINESSAQRIATLKGISPEIANRIVAERSEGAFRTDEDLARRVKGLGPRLIEQLREDRYRPVKLYTREVQP